MMRRALKFYGVTGLKILWPLFADVDTYIIASGILLHQVLELLPTLLVPMPDRLLDQQMVFVDARRKAPATGSESTMGSATGAGLWNATPTRF